MMKVPRVFYAVLLITTTFVVNCDVAGNSSAFTDAADSLNVGNLGTVISRQVAEHVAALTGRVNKQIAGINDNVQQEMQTLQQQLQHNMNAITGDMQKDLQGLGQTIEQRVHESLEPVNAVMIKSSMAHGIGGTTVALYGGKMEVIMKDGNKYTCPGKMVPDERGGGVRCTEELKYIPAEDTNICIENSYSRVNNIYCFGNYASFVCIDNSCQCRGGNMHTLDYLRSLCGETYGTGQYVRYDYYPNPNDSNRQAVPNPNKHVVCEGDTPGHCVWYSNGFILAATDNAVTNP